MSDIDANGDCDPMCRGRSYTWNGRIPEDPDCIDRRDDIREEEVEDLGRRPERLTDGGVPAGTTGNGGNTWTGVTHQKKPSARRNAWGCMSYADLIAKAIESTPEKRLTLSQIYDWMVQNVPYFKDKGETNSSAGWKNSIRHNLSLHHRFERVQNEGSGKSSWWVVNTDVHDRRSPRRRAASMDAKAYAAAKKCRTKQEDVPEVTSTGQHPSLNVNRPEDRYYPGCSYPTPLDLRAGNVQDSAGLDDDGVGGPFEVRQLPLSWNHHPSREEMPASGGRRETFSGALGNDLTDLLLRDRQDAYRRNSIGSSVPSAQTGHGFGGGGDGRKLPAFQELLLPSLPPYSGVTSSLNNHQQGGSMPESAQDHGFTDSGHSNFGGTDRQTICHEYSDDVSAMRNIYGCDDGADSTRFLLPDATNARHPANRLANMSVLRKMLAQNTTGTGTFRVASAPNLVGERIQPKMAPCIKNNAGRSIPAAGEYALPHLSDSMSTMWGLTNLESDGYENTEEEERPGVGLRRELRLQSNDGRSSVNAAVPGADAVECEPTDDGGALTRDARPVDVRAEEAWEFGLDRMNAAAGSSESPCNQNRGAVEAFGCINRESETEPF